MMYYNFLEQKSPPKISLQQQRNDFKAKIFHNDAIIYFESINPPQQKLPLAELNKFRTKLKPIQLPHEVLKLSELFFATPQHYVFKRIKELMTLFEEEEDNSISIESLKSMLTFLFGLHKFIEPSITLNENGLFQASWKKSNHNLVTLRFKEQESLDYVIFKPSLYGQKAAIFNGHMTIFDFKVKALNLAIELITK